jgi:predicted kinase
VAETQVASDVQQLAASLGPLPEAVVRPALIVISGLPGTGKSHFSRRLAERTPLVILESDALRKALLSVPTYSPEESARLFQAIHHLIEDLLRKGVPLILDATNLSERYRECLYSIASRLNAKLIIVRVEAPSELVRQRLGARLDKPDLAGSSDADWAVFQKMKPSVQPIRRKHFAVDTSRDITPVLEKIVREANR